MPRAGFNRQLCRGRPMDLFQLIRQDHQKAKRLFERLAETAGGTQSRPRLFAELKHELELHAEIEEEETEIFPLAQKLLDPAQLNTIASEIEKAKAAHKLAK